MAYATIEELQAGFRPLDSDEKAIAEALLDESAILIDAYNLEALEERKKLVTCWMVRRAIGDSSVDTIPIGASQGSMSGLGYSQSWTFAGGGTRGELYISKTEKRLLGYGNKIGSYSPVEELGGDE